MVIALEGIFVAQGRCAVQLLLLAVGIRFVVLELEVALCLARPDGAEGRPWFVFKGLVHPPHQLLRLRIAAPVDEAFLQEVLLGMVFQHL